MIKQVALLVILALASSAIAQTTGIRPDQMQSGTPDIVMGPDSTGNKFQIGTKIPWRTDTSAAPTFSATDAATIVELTNIGAITASLPDATGGTGNFPDGFGFAIQVKTGTLTLNRTTGSTINGLTSIKVGSYQSVVLMSRATNWYATLSVPQPASQTGTTFLADGMKWQ